MSRKSVLYIGLAGLLGALALGAIIFTIYINQMPNFVSQHETIILGQSQLAPGSRAALRVLVRDSKDAALLKGAQIKVSLKPSTGGDPIALFGGETNEQGTADVQFDVPEGMEGDQTLLIETSSALGSDYVERPVTIEREQRLLLTTDKPIYQPGQVIHMRVLALNNFDQRAAGGQEVEFVVADGKGNKVFRQRRATSEFGIAATNFVLADEVNAGDYKISAILGETTSEKTVSVKRYVLPKFEVTVSTDRSYYLPGQRVQGALQAAYFYGKPVSSGRVLIQGYTFDVERSDVFSLQGQTDQQGKFTFEFNMPDFLTGSELEGGLGRFYLEASVIDQANHSESTNLSLPVAGEALLIEAIPESGQFRPGVENILYVLTSYPDGTPAETSLAASSNGWRGSAQTGPYGLAELRLVPGGGTIIVEIQAQDSSGNRTTRQFQFEADDQAPI